MKMKKILLISFLLTLFAGFSFAQCPAGQVEIRVGIATDNWGNETYWTLSDLMGTVLMQGGQGGVYADYSNYSDSVCVPDNDCYFFEIWDTYGDGINAPYGYELYVNEVLLSSGSDDIQSYTQVTANCPDSCGLVSTALNDLQSDINGVVALSNSDLTLIKNIFEQFPECLAESDSIILLSKSVIEDYDNQIGALFTTLNTVNGFSKDTAAAPGLGLERAMVTLQQGVLDEIFKPDVYTVYPQHINDWVFNSCNAFPGFVNPPIDSSLSHSVLIRANFADPIGSNPYFNINGDGTDHALRPTGLYLAPGSIATVVVPDSLVGQDYYVRVGSHEWKMERESFFRLDRISKKFLIDSTIVEVFNPLGGAISILVPYGADDGILQVSVINAVECPFFSLKTFYETPDFSAELTKPGPWAVFETDNVMFTVPSHSIVPGQYDLMQNLLDWDKAIQGVNSIMGRQIIPDKHDMYMITDIKTRFGFYSIGYPMSNSERSFTANPGPVYFFDGPEMINRVIFHEHGHAIAMSKFPGEGEALVNFPYVMAMNYGLGMNLNQAVMKSGLPSTFDIDRTATHRMVSNTFGTERERGYTSTNEVNYQHRGYGHYFEIVNMFGWCPLRNFWKQESIDFDNGINHGIDNQDNDSRILRMSIAAQADLRPLFHVFGILPQDSIALQDTLVQIGIQPSLTIYNRLQDYFDLIPEDNAEFLNYALLVFPNLPASGPVGNPNSGVGWHYQKALTYDTTEAQQRTNILQGIVDYYFPNGAPPVSPIDVCCTLDTLNVSMVSEEVIVTGGVEPYEILIDTTGNLLTITVVDFDSCETTVQYPITSLTEIVTNDLYVFPNPTTGEVQIDFGTLQGQVSISAIDFSGKLIQTKTVVPHSPFSYQLPEAVGIYILKITYSDGEYRCLRVVKQ